MASPVEPLIKPRWLSEHQDDAFHAFPSELGELDDMLAVGFEAKLGVERNCVDCRLDIGGQTSLIGDVAAPLHKLRCSTAPLVRRESSDENQI